MGPRKKERKGAVDYRKVSSAQHLHKYRQLMAMTRQMLTLGLAATFVCNVFQF